jgi:ribosomal protein S12 methylthiotransferase
MKSWNYSLKYLGILKPRKVGQVFKCIIDRKEGGHFVGRTEFDSPDVDNEVLIDQTP